MAYKAKIRRLETGESIPADEPKRYLHKSSGSMRLRWKVGLGDYVEVYEHRVGPDGVVLPSLVQRSDTTQFLPCAECGVGRWTRARVDGTYPDRCRKCFGNGLSKGGLIGREEKYCWSCASIKDAGEFGANKGKHDELASECRDCCRKRSNDRYHSDPERVRLQYISRTYGLSQDEYEAMLLEQDGRCYLCNGVDEGKNLAVDHCHRTGKARRLLCSFCNMGLGMFSDNPDLLIAAAEYLREYE